MPAHYAPQTRKEWLLRHPHPGGVLIYPALRAIWLKPCKTAGTSIMRALAKDAEHLNGSKEQDKAAWRHWIDRSMNDDLDGWFTFSQVRHPLDRLASALGYYHIEPERWFDGGHTALFFANPGLLRHTIPLCYYTHDNARQRVDYVMRYEALQRDFDLLMDRLSLPARLLQHTNRSKHGAWRDWTAEWKEQAAEMYAADMAVHGYTIEEDM